VSDFNGRFQRALRALQELEAAPGTFTSVMALVHYKQSVLPKIRQELVRGEASVAAKVLAHGTTALDESYDEVERAEEISRIYQPEVDENPISATQPADKAVNFTRMEEIDLLKMVRLLATEQKKVNFAISANSREVVS
jgi:hypothetical protein